MVLAGFVRFFSKKDHSVHFFIFWYPKCWPTSSTKQKQTKKNQITNEHVINSGIRAQNQETWGCEAIHSTSVVSLDSLGVVDVFAYNIHELIYFGREFG